MLVAKARQATRAQAQLGNTARIGLEQGPDHHLTDVVQLQLIGCIQAHRTLHPGRAQMQVAYAFMFRNSDVWRHAGSLSSMWRIPAIPCAPWLRASAKVLADCPPMANTGRPACSARLAKRAQPMPGSPGWEEVSRTWPRTRKSAWILRAISISLSLCVDMPIKPLLIAGNVVRVSWHFADRAWASLARKCTPSAWSHQLSGCRLLTRQRAW